MVELVGIEGHQKQWATLIELLEHDRLSHAMAFVGPSGIGKRKVALALAKAGGASNESVLQIAPAGTMLKLEQAQEILNFLSLRSLSNRRFIIVDEAQTMNASFANSLLKILEEPPENTFFIFLLPAVSQLLPTIRSRLQTVRFFPLEDEVLARHSKRDDWMIKAAQGSFAKLEEWSAPEVAELKTRAMVALEDISQRRRDGLDAMSADIKERSSAELLARLFQQFFRDALCEGSSNSWSQYTKRQILEIWNESFQLQQDIAANLDRSLLFENFFYRSRNILGNAHGSVD